MHKNMMQSDLTILRKINVQSIPHPEIKMPVTAYKMSTLQIKYIQGFTNYTPQSPSKKGLRWQITSSHINDITCSF